MQLKNLTSTSSLCQKHQSNEISERSAKFGEIQMRTERMVAIDRIAAATQSDRINPLYSPDGVNVHPIGSFSPGKPDP